MNHEILTLLERVQHELTRPQAYRDNPSQGHLDAERYELRLSTAHETSIQIRQQWGRFQFRISVAAPPMPAPSAIRLAALLGRKKPQVPWLESVLPAEAEFGDLMRAGDAFALRFGLDELPSAKALARCTLQLTRRFEESKIQYVVRGLVSSARLRRVCGPADGRDELWQRWRVVRLPHSQGAKPA